MWRLRYGTSDSAVITVPKYEDIQTAAYYRYLKREPSFGRSQDDDWFAAENNAQRALCGQLRYRLYAAETAPLVPLARKLLLFSNKAHQFTKEHSADHPYRFLAGMGATLVGGYKGARFMQCLHNNYPMGWDAVPRIAHQVWQLQDCPKGRDLEHWTLAQWLLQFAREANCFATYQPNPEHALRVIGSLIIRDPWAAASAFGANLKQTRVHIRWMIRRDMPEVLAIEHASYEYPWCEEEFLRVLRQRNCIGMVAEHGERIVGFMIYELHRNKIHILDLAVSPDFRRRGVGRQLTAKLVGKLSSQMRNRLSLCVRETNLQAQLFLRTMGFRAIEVIGEHFLDTGEDAFTMACHLSEFIEDPAAPPAESEMFA